MISFTGTTYSMYFQELYAINEAKIASYSPSESQKIYERAVNRCVFEYVCVFSHVCVCVWENNKYGRI